MVPQSQRRIERNSSKVNLIISLTFHALIVVVGFYFAARGGLLGKQMKKIAVEMVKEKPPEKPKEIDKPKEPPKDIPKDLPKVETPKITDTPKISLPPSMVVPSAVAPPAADLPAFDFAGGKAVETSANPVELYRGLLQSTFTRIWDKPEDLSDDNFVAEVRVSVSPDGRISDPQWLKSSGNKRWDDSVREAVGAIRKMDRPPPTNFPSRVVVRFDVQEITQPILD